MGSEQIQSQLLANANHISYGSVNHPFSPPTTEHAIMERAISSEKMSVSRRFFVLLTVFDFLFTALIWIICTVTSDSQLASAFEREVVHYKIKSSVFDVVIVASLRAFLILLFYALLRISHWWVIATTTAGSGIFIVAKVLLYDWALSPNKTASIVLVLYSFVISWIEAWFLDCRVVPSELKSLEFCGKQDPERQPIVPHSALSRSQSDDGSAFFSPPGSDGEDEDEENEKEHDGSTVSEVEWLSPKNSGDGANNPSDENYCKAAEDALDIALKIINSDSWNTEKSSGNDTIYSKNTQSYGKVFKFVGVLDCKPKRVLDELYYRATDMHKWNPTVKKLTILKTVHDHLDIAHVIANESAAGLVASRDFINLRTWKKQGDTYIHGLIGTKYSVMPNISKYVRGEQGPSVYIISPIDGTLNKCKVQWLLNTNLKGWLPQYLIDQTLTTVMMDYMLALQKQITLK